MWKSNTALRTQTKLVKTLQSEASDWVLFNLHWIHFQFTGVLCFQKEDNWFSQTGKTIWAELLCNKNFRLAVFHIQGVSCQKPCKVSYITQQINWRFNNDLVGAVGTDQFKFLVDTQAWKLIWNPTLDGETIQTKLSLRPINLPGCPARYGTPESWKGEAILVVDQKIPCRNCSTR